MAIEIEWGDCDSRVKADQLGSDIVSPGSFSPKVGFLCVGINKFKVLEGDGDDVGIWAMFGFGFLNVWVLI
jgi:hypothetical protein